MKLNRKKTFIAVLVILIAAQAGYRFFVSSKKVADGGTLNLEKKVSVANEIKIQAKPVTFLPEKEMVFLVSIDSSQNKDFLEMDLMDVALLQDQDGRPYAPISWKVDLSTEQSRTGHLIFKAPPKETQSIQLIFFEAEERPFRWEMPHAIRQSKGSGNANEGTKVSDR